MKPPTTKWQFTVVMMLTWISLFVSIAAYSQEGGTPVTVTGRLDVQISENFNQEPATMAYSLQADNGPLYELQFIDSPPKLLHTGQIVTVQGIAEGNQLRVDTITFQAPDQAMPTMEDAAMVSEMAMKQTSITGQRRAVVLLVNFQDAQVATSTQTIADIMYSTTAQSVRDFYLQNSFGQLEFIPDSTNDGAPDIFGPYSINYNYNAPNDCLYDTWAQAAETAAGIDLSPYQHRIFILPPRTANSSCSWSGRANVGCSSGYPCRVWITDATIPIVYAHELGHNLGLMHAGTDPDNNGLINLNDEYADGSDPMGNSPFWHLFNAPNMDNLGWYTPYPGNITTVTGTGTYTLDVLDATPPALSPSNPRIIRLYWPHNKPGYYYLSYRQPLGYDASLATTYTQGVNIHWSQGPEAGAAPTGFVTALTNGATFTDSVAGIQVTQLGYSTNSVTVSISQPTNRPPSVSVISPTAGTGYYPNQQITFTGTAVDAEDGDLTANLTWTSNLDGVIGTGGSFTRKLSQGSHTIMARITDSGGLSRSFTLTVNVQPNTAPTVIIVSPANNGTYITDQAIAFSGIADDVHDGDRSSSLTWTSSLDGPIGTGPSFTRTLSAGTHTIQAQAADSTGLVGSNTVTINVVGNIAPTVTITAPADGATFTTDQAITFTGTATDPQDGNLTAGLSWISSIGGTIGSGGSFTRTLAAGHHTIQASVTDNKGATSTATLTVHVINPITATFISVGAEDGWVLESSETSNVGGSIKASDSTSIGLMLGDSSKKYQYKSILSFDTSTLPANATITAATLRLQRGTLSGTSPFTTHGSLLADIKTGGFNGNNALETADFQALPTVTGVATLSNAAGNGAWSEGTLNASGLAALNRTGRTQFRLYFTLDDDNDGTADYLGYYAGEYATAASRPQLLVNYVVNTPPVVTITAPATNTQVTPGTAITFSATASDTEDGNLNARLVWTSNRDGVIGYGPTFTKSTLSVGIHTITATVTDGFGTQKVASITLINSTNHLPTVTIGSPANGAGFITGNVIIFSATAIDSEDGDLSYNIAWNSNIDGDFCITLPVCTRILSVGTHTIEARVTDSGGFTGKATVTITVAPQSTLTFTSIGAEDGWVLESSETSNIGGSIKASDSTNLGLLLGDSSKKYQYKSILSFDTSSLPDNAMIRSATLRLQRGTLSGTSPFDTHGALLADVVTGTFNNNAALETADFQAPATAVGVAGLSNATGNGSWSEGTLDFNGLAAINKTGKTQFRLYFSLDDDNDTIADYLGYYAGEYATAASRPQLVVNYVVNTPPVVTITTPANEIQVAPGAPITFNGTATDQEDGFLSSRLIWTSDRDGVIGQGGPFTTSTLSVGIHTITATVTDNAGAQGSASITVINSTNHPPAVSIGSPANCACFIAGDTITFSGTAGDPEDGNLTANLNWTSNIDGVIGTGNSFARTLSVGTHTIQAQVTDSGGFTGKATITVTVDPPPTMTLNSIGAEDGWVLESSETSNVGGTLKASDSTSLGLMLGDSSKKYQYKSILSFDTAALPANATLLSATLRVQRGTLSGTSPFTTHGSLLADIKTGGFNGNNALETADFQAAASATGVVTLSNADSNGAWSEGALDVNGLAAINRTGRTQFRLYFSLDDDNDSVADYLGYYAGEYAAAASRPQLVVTYR
ncbi:MAG: DNRLRE domain-containing protein [Candidatus Competibacteraceae bacterium]